jgi:hypothetical protein
MKLLPISLISRLYVFPAESVIPVQSVVLLVKNTTIASPATVLVVAVTW